MREKYPLLHKAGEILLAFVLLAIVYRRRNDKLGNSLDGTMQGLLEAVEIEKGNISLIQKENMPAPTFIASDREKELIDEL